jgi:hypothetical protein
MLTAKSRVEPNIRYLFESRVPPVTAEELAKGNYVGTPATIEATLTLSISHAPIEDAEFTAWKRIMNDCAHPDLKAAYNDCYRAVIRFLNSSGVNGESYRVHTLRTRG